MNPIAGESPSPPLFPEPPGQAANLGPGVRLLSIGPDRRLEAAMRLVGDQSDDPWATAERFLQSSELLGIDLSILWATESGAKMARDGGNGGMLRQVALAVPGSGRTVMLFVSGPGRRRRGSIVPVSELGAGSGPTSERVAVIQACCAAAGQRARSPILAQSLLEKRETEALIAFRAAGFRQLGDLAYLRRLGPAPSSPESGCAMPAGVEVRSVADLLGEGWTPEKVEAALLRGLERSYIDTLDCPELCGLRRPEDVLESHRTVGRYNPAMWWVALVEGEAEGCMLLTVCPEHESVELVYLGLSPRLRGHGLGKRLLLGGLRHVLGAPSELDGGSVAPGRCVVGTGGVTCAVDTRNAPAMSLYRAMGFQRFAVRVPMVMPVGG